MMLNRHKGGQLSVVPFFLHQIHIEPWNSWNRRLAVTIWSDTSNIWSCQLPRSGYSRLQACGMLFLLYIMVFVLEIILLYVGWRVLGLGGDTSEEGFNDDMMEEL
eukprot:g31996.t1